MSEQVEEKEVVSYESDGTKKVTKTISKTVKTEYLLGQHLQWQSVFAPGNP